MSREPNNLEVCRALLDQLRYREVLTQVDVDSPVLESDRAEALVIKAWAQTALGTFDLSLVDRALALLRQSTDLALLARAKFLRGQALVVQPDLLSAQEELTEAYVFYKRLGDLRGLGRVANALSYVFFQQARYDDFFQMSEQALRHYAASEFAPQRGMILVNMAMAFHRAGLLSSSARKLSEAEAYLNLLSPNHQYNFWHVQAMASVQRGHVSHALEALTRASVLPGEFRREHCHHLEVSGLVFLLAGQLEDARSQLLEGLQVAEQIGDGTALFSQIRRLLADVSVLQQKYDVAKRYAAEALRDAESINERLEIAACWRVFAQVAVYEGQPDEAREWFRKAIDLFNQISSRYELAVTRYLSACSGLFGQTESIALLYLAKEYFESEQVAPYITKVQAALGSFRRPTIALRASASGGSRAVQIVTVNKAMLATLELARNVAPSSMDVLLTGETGTGKDLLARYIHEYSGCAGAFISQNVTTLPATMIEAELFGHKRGSFTGADQNRDGLIKQAENGTLFLNEIGDASLELQTKLLEVLETRRVRSIGEDKDQPVRFRLIAATNADLREGVRSGKFRPDLYHRLNQVTITLPPLRMRLDDLEPLVRCFLSRLGRHNGDALQVSELVQVLSTYSWPGNVRELEHSVGRLWLLCGGNVSRMAEVWATESAVQEQDQLDEVLADCGGNQRAAARRLGIGESTLRYRLKKRGE